MKKTTLDPAVTLARIDTLEFLTAEQIEGNEEIRKEIKQIKTLLKETRRLCGLKRTETPLKSIISKKRGKTLPKKK